MTEANPDRDFDIIRSRGSVAEAEKRLLTAKSGQAALELQRLQQKWNAQRELTIVKKKPNEACG